MVFFFFKQKTAYEMRISDWSSDVCSSDLEQLFRVMVNIGRNALDAGARRIEVTAAVRVGWISLAVKDDGPGIPAKARERLFQPFVGSGKADGNGLGLAIARERKSGRAAGRERVGK